jgi:hypothetical protein
MPASAARKCCGVGDGKTAGAWWRRHAPAHRDQLALVSGVTHHRRGIVRKHPGHRRQIADVPIHHSEERNDGCLARIRKGRCNNAMSTKSRQVIYGSRIRGAKIRAEGAREAAAKAIRAADRAEAEAWSIQMEGYGGPAQPSPTIGQCLNGGYGWLEVECHRCKTRASLPLDAIRRPRNTRIWKLEAALKCRSCRKGRYAPPVHMIKLTQEREIAPYGWAYSEDR